MKSYFILPLLLQKLIWAPTRLILGFFGHMRIEGLYHLGGLRGPVIFAMNHSSEIDPFIIPASLPFWSRFSPLFYATKERAFYDRSGWRKYLFGGLFIKAWGGYTVQSGFHDYAQSLVVHAAILCDGGSFCVFPEGGITPDGLLQPGKGGIAYLAESTKCSIIPVGVSGVHRTTVGQFFGRKRRIVVCFGAPIRHEELRASVARSVDADGNVYKEEAQYVMKRVGELLKI